MAPLDPTPLAGPSCPDTVTTNLAPHAVVATDAPIEQPMHESARASDTAETPVDAAPTILVAPPIVGPLDNVRQLPVKLPSRTWTDLQLGQSYGLASNAAYLSLNGEWLKSQNWTSVNTTK